MEKIELAIRGLKDEERTEIQQIFEDEKIEADVQELIEKDYVTTVTHVVKIIFYGFNIWEWARDGVLWGILTAIINKILELIKKKTPNAEVQIIVKYGKTTIAFPTDDADKEAMLDKLPDEFEKLDPKTNKITSVTYSKETSSVEIRQL